MMLPLLRLRFPRSVRHTALPLLPRKHTALKLVRSTSNRAARAHRPPIIFSTPHSCPTAYQTHTHVTEMFKAVSVIQAEHVAAPWDTNKVGAGRRIDKRRSRTEDLAAMAVMHENSAGQQVLRQSSGGASTPTRPRAPATRMPAVSTSVAGVREDTGRADASPDMQSREHEGSWEGAGPATWSKSGNSGTPANTARSGPVAALV